MTKVAAFALGLYVFGVLGGFVCGCAPALPAEPAVFSTIENGAAVAQYKLLLDDCRAKGKAAKSYATYETCADAVDAELCRARSVRCAGGAK